MDTQGHDGMTLGDLINQAKETEAVRNKMKVQDDAQKSGAGKRLFAVFEARSLMLGRVRGRCLRRYKPKAKGQAKAKARGTDLKATTELSVVSVKGHTLPKNANGNRAPATHVVRWDTQLLSARTWY